MQILDSDFIRKIKDFEWDQGNKEKSLKKHNITNKESEEPFFDRNNILLEDLLHQEKEDRYIIIGATKNKKILFIVFTIRKDNIRIISSRIANKKEVNMYEKRT